MLPYVTYNSEFLPLHAIYWAELFYFSLILLNYLIIAEIKH